ncbi:MAG TPA: serine/threonine-protein kinase [Polyangiaceae bacterium]|nr:serine/threonine-protein kinase [Polyangiaceae bacterium]
MDTGNVTPEPAPRSSGPRYREGDFIGGKYRLGRRLGEGGMGDVWLAHNETLDIDVALKLIRGELATPEMAERLLHEARAAARLGHPAIVRVNDFGKTDRGDPFIVMELLEGEDLAAALATRGRLNAVVAVRTLLPIAHALMVAHNKGIVHRDLKPENVFLAKSDDGKLQPKLVDFGVAKLERVRDPYLTQSREVVGSPLYMSPEQARGDEVDHRADIWAFAVVLYEAITGAAPFQGKNYNSLLYSIIANPATSVVDLGVGDADLWATLERGLRKEADQRWFSMRDFGEALAHWLEDREVREDITGASLSATWLDWKKDEDELHRPPAWGEDGARISQLSGALPPPPELLPEVRARVETIRKSRPPSRNVVTVAVALFCLALVIVLLATRESSPPRSQAAQAVSASVSAAPAPEPAKIRVEPPEDVEHERAVEAALAAAGAPSASATPTFVAARPPERPHHGPRPDTLSHGIHTADPYAASTATRRDLAGKQR